MDSERHILSAQNSISSQQVENLRVALSESLHQVKNPVQAIRTFGKLLRREIAEMEARGSGAINELEGVVEVTESMMLQSERVLELIKPMDGVAERMFVLGGGVANTTNSATTTSTAFDVEFETSDTEAPPELFPDINYSLETVDVVKSISSILSAAKVIATERDIDFSMEYDDEIEAKVDARALRECLANVVDNAFKYCCRTEGMRRVRVTIRGDTTGTGAEIVVENDYEGNSIPAKERELIFHREYRGGLALKKNIDGTGLGLGIARGLLRRMRGDLQLVVDDKKELDIAFRIMLK